MQLEKYVRTVLVKNTEETQNLIIPVLAEIQPQATMSRQQNTSSSHQQQHSQKLDSDEELKIISNVPNRCNNGLSVSTRHRSRPQNRLRRTRNKCLGTNIKKNKKLSSIPIQHYNSL
jgi:hypothetical protein